MVTTILPQAETQFKAPELVLRIGPNGITALQILARSSAEEEQLRERLSTARPILDLLGQALNTPTHEPVGVDG